MLVSEQTLRIASNHTQQLRRPSVDRIRQRAVLVVEIHGKQSHPSILIILLILMVLVLKQSDASDLALVFIDS